nr:hypothetical protein Iba_chr05dCG2130 [Ipomoea batatas]GMD00811.1 hypothetical protein Iba_chr05fCG1420 [Ipomoea batatas]
MEDSSFQLVLAEKQVHSHVQFRVQLGTWTFLLFDHPVPQMSDAWTGQQPTLTVFICLTVKLVTMVPRVGFTITCLSVSLQISGLGVLHIDRATICSLSISDALWIEKLPNHAWLLPTVSPFSHLGSGILALKPIQALCPESPGEIPNCSNARDEQIRKGTLDDPQDLIGHRLAGGGIRLEC